eukprot:TRINITY_DN24294_c0_g1_i2.p1 TRINITY_DN24294_c0_g1~~TRINITY_DN24294_c0_g1_i2.p1  ORF type:complete len:739 (+),score=250.72 TRINITY_DN24294_c0_g1_i2:69-2285(+)
MLTLRQAATSAVRHTVRRQLPHAVCQHREYTEIVTKVVNEHLIVSCLTGYGPDERAGKPDADLLKDALAECSAQLDAIRQSAAGGAFTRGTHAQPALVVMHHRCAGTKDRQAEQAASLVSELGKIPEDIRSHLIGFAVNDPGHEVTLNSPEAIATVGPCVPATLSLTAFLLPADVEYRTTLAHRASDGIPPLPQFDSVELEQLRSEYRPLIVGLSCTGDESSHVKCLNMFPESQIAFELPKRTAPEIYVKGERHEKGQVCAAVYVKDLDINAASAMLSLSNVGMCGRGHPVMTSQMENTMYLPNQCVVPHIPLGLCYRMQNLDVPKPAVNELPYTQTPRVLGFTAKQAKSAALCHLCSYPLAMYKDLTPASATEGVDLPTEWELRPIKLTPARKSKPVDGLLVKRAEMVHTLLFSKADTRVSPSSKQEWQWGGYSEVPLTCPSCTFPVGHRFTPKCDHLHEDDVPPPEFIALNLKRITSHNMLPAVLPQDGGAVIDTKQDTEDLLRQRGHNSILCDFEGDLSPEDFFDGGMPLPVLPELISEMDVLPGQTCFVKVLDRSHMAVLKKAFDEGKSPHIGFPFVNSSHSGVIAKVVRATFLSSPEGLLHLLICAKAVARCSTTGPAQIQCGTQHYHVERLVDENPKPKSKAILETARKAALILGDSWAKLRLAKLQHSRLTAQDLEALSFEILARCPRDVLLEAQAFSGSRNTLERLEAVVSLLGQQRVPKKPRAKAVTPA